MPTERFYLFQRGGGLVALAAVCLSALMYGGVTPLAWSMLAFIVTIIFALFVFRSFFVSTSPFPKSPLLPSLAYVFVLFSCALAASSYSITPSYWGGATSVADPGATMQGVARLGMYGMLFIISASAFNSVRSATFAMKSIAIWSSCLAIYGFYAFLSDDNPILGDLDPGGVLKASFVNRNHYATYAAFGMITNLGAYLSTIQGRAADQPMKRRAREVIERFFGGAWVFAIGALVCGAATAATASRAGALAGLFGLLVFLVAWSGRTRKVGYIGYGFIVLAAAFVIFSSATNLFDRFSAIDGQEGRFLVYPAVLQGIWERPFFGHGLGSFPDAFQSFLPLDAARGTWTQAHNSYLENVFEMGIPLTSLFYLTLILITWRIFRATRDLRRNRAFACVGLGCIATAALHAGFDFSLQIPSVTALFAVILGMSWAHTFSETEIKRHRIG